MSLLEVSDICKTEEGTIVLKNLSFVQKTSQRIAIAGESGAGKTTLLKIIGGLTQPDRGQVIFEGKRVEGPSEKLIPGHPGIAYLSQHFELRNHYRVEEILEYANKLLPTAATQLYSVCRIDHLLKRWTHQVSGGERQRIALARLLISSPRLLLLDEPYSNLDQVHKNILRSVIDDLGEKLNITCLLSSHDPADTLSWADEIIVIRNGVVVQHDSPKNIYRRPLNGYVSGLFGKYIPVTGRLKKIFPQLLNKKISFLRPQDFRIALPGEASVEGVVRKAGFMGGYFELEVTVQGTNITMNASANRIAGTVVRIALADD